MGQIHGKAAYLKAAMPFVNASEKDVNKLWETFNDVAEGFGLNVDEMNEICRVLQPTLEIHTKVEMDQLSTALFTTMDTDQNGLVDALEFLGTIALMSAMTIHQKLTFVYNCYDFNESGQISIDELTLALKSTLTGLCKLTSGILCPTEMVLEEISLHTFHKAQKNGPDDFITLHEFLKFADTTPEMTSWLDYFDSPEENVEVNDREDSDLEEEFPVFPIDQKVVRKHDINHPFDLHAPILTPDSQLPLKPWQSVVANITPSAPPRLNPSSPSASLELEWVYGLNSDYRNVVKYISASEIIFPAGNVAVLYDVVEHEQRFAFHHTGHIQAIALHPSTNEIVATAERSAIPKVCIWNTKTLALLSVIRGFHQNGVSHLAWMPHGKGIVTVGQDLFHNVAVYEWETLKNTQENQPPRPTNGTLTGSSTFNSNPNAPSIDWTQPAKLVFANRTERDKIHALLVLENEKFVTCGRRHLFFWSKESEMKYTSEHSIFVSRPGILGRKTKIQTLLSVCMLQNDPNMLLAGGSRGQILLFEGRNCIKIIHAHASAVNVLHSFSGGILSGGKDGKIRFWSKRMEPGAQFDIEALGSIHSRIRSLSTSPDGGAKMLIATSGAEIYEIASSDGSNLHFGAILCGHFSKELYGLDTNPLKKEFCTIGEDETIRIWDMEKHRLIRMATLHAPSRTCAYSPDAKLIAVGQGTDETKWNKINSSSSSFQNKQGAFAILNEKNLAIKYEAKDSKKFICQIKFSSDGLTLGVCTNDHCIFLYHTEDWASKGKCKARDASILLSHFDFSSTGEYIMANAMNKNEMVFFETASGIEMTRIATLKDVEWHTWTCPFGWPVQGIWQTKESKSYDVVTLDRSFKNSNNSSTTTITNSVRKDPLLIVGDNFGRLRLFRYPCVEEFSNCQIFYGHSSSISNVKFSFDNTHLLSVGKEERCIFQWRIEYEEEQEQEIISNPSHTQKEEKENHGALVGIEFEYHPNSEDELELNPGQERTLFEEAINVGDFALELLHYSNNVTTTNTSSSSSSFVMRKEQQEEKEKEEEEKQKQKLPMRPWVASSIGPVNGPDEKDLELSSIPMENLELEWIYGYRCHDVRNNVFISKEKNFWIYPAANCVILFDPTQKYQRHFKQHTDEVTSLACHFGSTKNTKLNSTTSKKNQQEIVASGQMGQFPIIHIWKVDTLEILATLRGFHRHGIGEMRFNPNGNLLATVGLDEQNTLGIYDWQNGVLLAHASTNSIGKIMGINWQQQQQQTNTITNSTTDNSSILVTVGVKTISFWRLQGQNLIKKQAILGKKGLVQTFLSVIFCSFSSSSSMRTTKFSTNNSTNGGGDAIVGTTSGDLYRFQGIELMSIVPAHTSHVFALFYCQENQQIVSGGKDGSVKIWSQELECLMEFTSFQKAKAAAPICSIFWEYDQNLLLIGTRASCLYPISSLDGSQKGSFPIIQTHFKKECHGLSICASKERFCTVGDDGFLRVYDLHQHEEIMSKALETSSRACCFSYDGEFIAIGLGGNTKKRHKKDGSLLIFEEKHSDSSSSSSESLLLKMELVYETRDTKQPISCLKYSPDGQFLVVGSLDNQIYIYDVVNQYTKRAVFNKHKSGITHLDISCDSQYLRSNCEGKELLFADITTGSHVASATALRNQKWDTCNTIYNWYNQGTWPSSSSSSSLLQVACCSTSQYGSQMMTSTSSTKTILATGDTHGTIKIFKFPCFVKGAGFKQYRGHSGEIASIGFNATGSYCFSLGKKDRCVFQWRKTNAILSTEQEKEQIQSGSGSGDAATTTSTMTDQQRQEEEQDTDLHVEGLFIPETFINVPTSEIKPYISHLSAPSDEKKNKEPSELDGDANKIQFELEHVFGYRTFDVRNTVVYSKNKKILYATGCLGVQYDRRMHQQQFYMGHTRPIVSLASSNDGSLIATGEMVTENVFLERPRIHIWEPSSCSLIQILSEFHQKAISYLAFSPNRKMLASIGQDQYHSLCIYHSSSGLWFDGAMLGYSRTSRQKVFFVNWIEDPAASFHLVTGGHMHVLFWKMDGPHLIGIQGVFGEKASIQPMLCGQSMGTNVILGTNSGHLYVWESAHLSKAIPAHSSAVFCLHATSNGCVSGSKDGHIKVWSRKMIPLSDFDMNDVKPAVQNPSVRSICWDIAEDRLLVGTKGGEILEISRLTNETSLVTESHFENELFGLSLHPIKNDLVATAGEDRTVRIWNLTTRQVDAKVFLDAPLHSITYSSDGKLIAVGFGGTNQVAGLRKDGTFMILDANTLEILYEGRDSKHVISDIKFSPNMTLLALGSHDNCVYFYSILDNYSLRFKFPKATGKITHLDFSSDSAYVRINSDAYELLYVNTLDGSQVTSASSMKDTEWDTQSCVFTWATQGLWDPADESTYYHAVNKSSKNALMAAGTNKGQIRIYNYPCLSKNTHQIVLKGHGTNITNVAFTRDESRFVSIGGGDKTLAVWKVLPKPVNPHAPPPSTSNNGGTLISPRVASSTNV